MSTVQQVVEEVVSHKELPPDMYALYLVLGDSESHRVLCFSERLLAVIYSASTDFYLCLQRNAFYETLCPYVRPLTPHHIPHCSPLLVFAVWGVVCWRDCRLLCEGEEEVAEISVLCA